VIYKASKSEIINHSVRFAVDRTDLSGQGAIYPIFDPNNWDNDFIAQVLVPTISPETGSRIIHFAHPRKTMQDIINYYQTIPGHKVLYIMSCAAYFPLDYHMYLEYIEASAQMRNMRTNLIHKKINIRN